VPAEGQVAELVTIELQIAVVHGDDPPLDPFTGLRLYPVELAGIFGLRLPVARWFRLRHGDTGTDDEQSEHGEHRVAGIVE
jgi:hypothetical protein